MKDQTKVKAVNVWKVAEVKANNPNATYAEIEEETGLAPATISKATQELKQNWSKDETITYIVGSAKERLKKTSKIFDQIIDDAHDTMFNADWTRKMIKDWELEFPTSIGIKEKTLIKDLAKDDMARITVLWWDITNPDWGFKSIKDMMFDSEIE